MFEDLSVDEDNPDVQEIMLEIRRAIAHRKSGGWEERPFGRFDHSVYDHLFQALSAFDQSRVDPSLSPTFIPVIGPLWHGIRRQAHKLVLYYLDQLSRKQIYFNRQITKTAEGIVQSLEAEPRPADLQAEIATLQQQVMELKAQLAGLVEKTE